MKLDQSKDKSNFVVAFLAAVLALVVFEKNLKLMKVHLGFYEPTLFQIISLFSIFLGLSAYFYALDYIRYGTKFQNNFLFRLIIPIADFLYVLSMIIPIGILIIWIGNIFLNKMSGLIKEVKNNIYVINSLFSVLIGILGSFFSLVYTKKRIIDLEKELSESFKIARESRLEKANKFYAEKFYSVSILEAFKVLELTLRSRLEEKGFRTKNLKIIDLSNLALKMGLITKNDLSYIKELRAMRNKVAHLDISFSKENADFVFKSVKNILDKLEEEGSI